MEYVLHQTLQKHATLSVCSADHAALTSTNAVTRPPDIMLLHKINIVLLKCVNDAVQNMFPDGSEHCITRYKLHFKKIAGILFVF